MNLEANVLIHRPPEEVWAYLDNVSHISEWDRGVAGAQSTSSISSGVGFEFDTLAHPRGKQKDPSWGKMSYRVTETDPDRGCTVQLTSTDGNARFFKTAEWRFRIEAEQSGSRVFCTAHFLLRLQDLLLAPIFYFMKKAIRRDLVQLKEVLEKPAA